VDEVDGDEAGFCVGDNNDDPGNDARLDAAQGDDGVID
jgi:hypothetical protein